MTTVAELGLTPTQHAELEQHDPALITAWLAELDKARDVKNPAGWFLSAVRTGNMPGATVDQEKARQTHLAETYIRNAGLYLPTETEVTDHFQGPHGRLRQWADDQRLSDRLVELWRDQQPRAEQATRDTTARAEKFKATRALATTTAEGEPEPFDNSDSERDWSET